MKNRLIGSASWLPLFAPETGAGAGGEGELDISDAANAFLNAWKDPKEETPSGTPEEGQEETPEETQEEETPEETQEEEETEEEETPEGEEEEGEETKPKPQASDDLEVVIAVDGEERKVSVKDLKRLYGQEAEITKKSQEVATARQAADAKAQHHATALDRMFKAAQARWEPYSKMDFLVLSKSLDDKTFAQLRKEAVEAHEDFQFFGQELEGFVKKTQEEHGERMKAQAGEAWKALSDPEKGIKGWGQQLYSDVRSYAVKSGMPEAVVNQIVDPSAIKLIHKAMLYDKSKTVAAPKKVVNAAKKVVRPNAGTGVEKGTNVKQTQALTKLRKSGSSDDAAAAFLAKWAD